MAGGQDGSWTPGARTRRSSLPQKWSRLTPPWGPASRGCSRGSSAGARLGLDPFRQQRLEAGTVLSPPHRCPLADGN